MQQEIAVRTPLQLSVPLSECISHEVYLKLENVQPYNSFKIRGIEQLCKKKAGEGCQGFVTFSGGNAGITLAYIAHQMKMPCHIVLPAFVSTRIINRMKSLGAQIQVAATGREAYNQALELTKNDPSLAFIHPYDDEDLWAGYSKIVNEIKEQLGGERPSCIVLSVGGGGLLMGILKGLKLLSWQDTPVLAMETIGAHSLNKSIKAGKIIENVLTSIAKTLGAPFVVQKLLDILPSFKIASAILPDADAVEACLKFAEHHNFLVEPACGVSLAAVYSKVLPRILQENGFDFNEKSGPVVIIVCGGNDTGIDILRNHAEALELAK